MTVSDLSEVDDSDMAERAKGALERVCSGAGLDPPSRYYSPSFVDHVNGFVLHGFEGIHASVELYKQALSDLRIDVQDQSVTGHRVTSRFVVTGTSYGRRVRFTGITISRFENGLIVEDWSVTDTFGMLQQLGLWRALLMGFRNRKTLKAASTPGQAHAGDRAPSSSACARTDGLQNASVLRKT